MPLPQSAGSDLQQLAQLFSLFQSDPHEVQAQQAQAMAQYHMQSLAQQQQQHAAVLKQSIAHDLWQQQHAVAQETNADKRAQLAQEMEQDRSQIGLFHGALQGGVPYAKALQFLPDRMQQNLLKQHQAEIAAGLPGAQSLVEGIYNNPEKGRKGVDPNMLAMTALAGAGLRPQDYMGQIDYSGMNPYPGFKATEKNPWESYQLPISVASNPMVIAAQKRDAQQGREIADSSAWSKLIEQQQAHLNSLGGQPETQRAMEQYYIEQRKQRQLGNEPATMFIPPSWNQ